VVTLSLSQDFGAEWNAIYDAIVTIVQAIPNLTFVRETRRAELDEYPVAHVISELVSTDQLTAHKTYTRVRVEIPVFVINSDITAGMVESLVFAGQIADAVGADRTLSDTIVTVEAVTITPHWGGFRGYERSCVAVTFVAEFIRR